MAEENPYLSFLDKPEDQNPYTDYLDPSPDPVRAILRQARKASPEQAAEDIKTAAKNDVPVPAVTRNRDAFKAEAQTNEYMQYLDGAPVTKEAVSTPAVAEATHDDIGALAHLEKMWKSIPRRYNIGNRNVEISDIERRASFDRARDGDEERLAVLEKEAAAEKDEDLDVASEIPGAMAEMVPMMTAVLGRSADEVAMGGTAGALVGSVVPGIGTAAGAATGLTTGLLTGAAMETAKLEYGLALNEYKKFTDLAGKKLDRDTVRGVAMVVGAVNGALEVVTLRQLGKVVPGYEKMKSMLTRDGIKQLMQIPTIRNAFARLGRAVVRTGLTEGFVEAAQEISLIAGAVVGLDQKMTASEMGSRVGESFKVGAQAGGGFAVVGGSIQTTADIMKARRATQRAQGIAALGEAIRNTKTIERLPQHMQTFFTALKEEYGTIEEVSIDHEALTTYFQKAGVTPEALRQQAPHIADAMDAALTEGGDVKISIEDLATEFAPSENFADLVQDIRFKDGEPTSREAIAQQEKIRDMADEATQAAIDIEEDPVYQDVQQQLEAAGHTAEMSDLYARIWSGFFRTQAAELGITGEELYRQRTVQIRREGEQEASQVQTDVEMRMAEDLLNLEQTEPGREIDEDYNYDAFAADVNAALPENMFLSRSGQSEASYFKLPSLPGVELRFADHGDRHLFGAEGRVQLNIEILEEANRTHGPRGVASLLSHIDANMASMSEGLKKEAYNRAVENNFEFVFEDQAAQVDEAWDEYGPEVLEDFHQDIWERVEEIIDTFDDLSLQDDPRILKQIVVAPEEVKGNEAGEAEDQVWRSVTHKRTKKGKILGAPTWAQGKGGILRLRNFLNQLVTEGLPGRFWYEESAREALIIARGDYRMAEKFIGLLAIYSPQRGVFVNTGFAVKAYNQWSSGQPISVNTADQDIKAKEWLDKSEDWGGRKVNSFYLNIMHELINSADQTQLNAMNIPPDVVTEIKRATVDVWVLRALGYDVDSTTGTDLGSGKYSFAEKEIQRIAGKLNENLKPGEQRWLPHQVQAALWTAIKGRYEIPSVKALTNAESKEAGLSVIDPETGKLVNPKENTPERVAHMKIWRKHALAADPAAVAASVETAKGSFATMIQRMTQTVMWEAMPGPDLKHPVNKASKEVRKQFTEEATALIMDEDGSDILAGKLDLPLHHWVFSSGGFEKGIADNIVTSLLPTKPAGIYDQKQALVYARLIQYIYMQKAVPIMRADDTADFDGDYAIVNSRGRNVRVFNTVTEAEAELTRRLDSLRLQTKKDGELKAGVAEKIKDMEKWTINAGPLSRGMVFTFKKKISAAAQKRFYVALRATLGADPGFTRLDDNTIVVVNFRGNDTIPGRTNMPWAINDADFVDKLGQLGQSNVEIEKVDQFGSEGEYGPEQDWSKNRAGKAFLRPVLAGRSPALQKWVRGRRNAFEKLLKEYEGQNLVDREADVAALKAMAKQRKQDHQLYQTDQVSEQERRSRQNLRIQAMAFENDVRSGLVTRDTPGIDVEEFDAIKKAHEEGRVFYQGGGFFSPSRRAVEEFGQDKATGEQWRKHILGTAGTSKEMDFIVGLDELLKSEGTITKADLAAFIDQNGIKMDEVVLSEPVDEVAPAVEGAPTGAPVFVNNYPTQERVMEQAWTQNRWRSQVPWGDHMLGTEVFDADGDSTFELRPNLQVLQNPDGTWNLFDINAEPEAVDPEIYARDQYPNMWQKIDDFERSDIFPDDVTVRRVTDFPGARYEVQVGEAEPISFDDAPDAYSWVIEHMTETAGLGDEDTTAGFERRLEFFRSQTFETTGGRHDLSDLRSILAEPNVYEDPVIEQEREVRQSGPRFTQWNKGMEGGTNHREFYLTLPKDKSPANAKVEDYLVPVAHRTGIKEADTRLIVRIRVSDFIDANGNKTMVIQEIQDDEGLKAPEHDPFRPFGGQNKWVPLALKRVLLKAVEEGYNSISWTPGEVQAERYDLSAMLETLEYSKGEDGTYSLHGYEKVTTRKVIDEMNIEEKELANYVGKELADKIIAGEGEERGIRKQLSGIDLKVGGEGLKRLYDKVVVNSANKIGKKHGAKVGVITLDTRIATSHRYLHETQQREEDEGAVRDAGLGFPEIGPGGGVGFLTDADGPFAGDIYTMDMIEAEPSISDDVVAAAERLEQGLLGTVGKEGQDVWTLPITDKLREAVEGEGLPLFHEEIRGFIKFTENRKFFELTMTGKANKSTFLHESGHFFLEIMGQIVASGAASQRQLDDYATIKKFLKIKPGELTTKEQHEKFARAFEAYLREGKAPSVELLSAFQTFKQWLKEIYTAVRMLNVNINDDVRGVFDRLLASDEAISQAAQNQGFVPAFMNFEESGLTEEKYAEYVESYNAAFGAVREDMDKKMMAEIEREKKAETKELRDEVWANVTAEVNERPVYRARHFLSKGVMLDETEVPEEIKGYRMSTGALKNMGVEIKRLVGLHSNQGIHPDEIAPHFGFDTGQEMVEALIEAQAKTTVIKEEADRRMKAIQGDMMTDGSIGPEAAESLHDNSVTTFLLTELRLMNRQAGIKPLPSPARVLKDAAVERIAGLPIAKVRPEKYRQAEAKASREAAVAVTTGDFATAANAKQRQMLNHYLYKEAVKARQSALRIRTYLIQFGRKKKRQSLGKAGENYLDAIDALIEGIDLRNISLRRLEGRQALADFIAQQEAAEEPISIPQHLRDETQLKNFKNMTIDELREVRDAVKNINHLAMFKNKLKRKNELRERGALIQEMEDRAERTGLREPNRTTDNDLVQNKGWWDNRKDFMQGLRSGLLKTEFLFKWLDGEVGGLAHEWIFQPLAEAQHMAMDMRKHLHKRVFEPLNNLPRAQRARWASKVKFLGVELSGHEIIAVALNMGNEGNIQRLTDGYQHRGWTEDRVRDALNQWMTKADWDMVQLIWDEVDVLYTGLKDERGNMIFDGLSDVTQRATGLRPPKVEAVAFDTPHGTYKGGYYPIVYDPSRSTQAQQQLAEKTGIGMFENNFMRPEVSASASHARAAQVKRPLLLSLDVLGRHVFETVHFISHYDAITQADKIMSDDRFKALFEKKLGTETYKRLRPWLQNIANDGTSLEEITGIQQGFAWARGTTSVMAMGLSASTAMMQWFGVITALDAMPFHYWAANLRRAFQPGAWEQANEESGEIRHLTSIFDREVRMMMDQAFGKTGIAAKRAKFNQAMFLPMAYAQKMVNVATYFGAKEHALADGKTEEQAIAHAEAIVRMTQSGAGAKDLAAIQRGGEGTRLVTQFMTFFSVLYNRLDDVVRLVGTGKQSIPHTVGRISVLLVIPAMLEAYLRDPPDEEDEENWLQWHLTKIFLYGTATIPIIRDIASGALGEFGYTMTPAARAFETLARSGGIIEKVMEDEDLTDAQRRAAITAAAVAFKLPSSTINRIVDYAMRQREGEVERPFRDLVFGERRK